MTRVDAQPTAPTARPANSQTPALLYWAVAALLIFPALGKRDLWKSEARWGEVTREMFLSGNFLRPTINGTVYFDKPLLGYWLIAATAKLTGGLSEWSVRFPSAIAGLITLAATISLGRKLWSEQVARTAGWLLLTTYGFLFYARLGMADMENLASITLAVAWYAARRDKPGFLTFLIFYLICFTGAHTKGLTAVVVPALVLLPDLIARRAALIRQYATLSHAAALAIGIAIYLIPFVLAGWGQHGFDAEGLQMVFRENFQRFTDPFDHDEKWYVYFYHLPTLFLPWTPLLLLALLASVLGFFRLPPASRWMLLSIALIFIFFSVSGSRRIYYLLPILPYAALLTADWLARTAESKLATIGLTVQRGLALLACILSIATLAAWPFLKSKYGFEPPRLLHLVTPIIGVLAILPLLFPRAVGAASLGLTAKLAPIAVAAAILFTGFFALQLPTFDAFRQERAFANDLRAQLAAHPTAKLAFFHRVPETFIYYMNSPTPIDRVWSTETIAEFLKAPGDKVLITQAEYLKRLSRMEVPDSILNNPTLRRDPNPWQPDDPDLLIAYIIKS